MFRLLLKGANKQRRLSLSSASSLSPSALFISSCRHSSSISSSNRGCSSGGKGCPYPLASLSVAGNNGSEGKSKHASNTSRCIANAAVVKATNSGKLGSSGGGAGGGASMIPTNLTFPKRLQTTNGTSDAGITKARVWSLWNEGNLFSLSIPELVSFLNTYGGKKLTPDSGLKKSALVREVEDLMNKEQQQSPLPPAGVSEVTEGAATVGGSASAFLNPEEAAAAAAATTYDTSGSELAEEADVYGDWGAEPGFEDRKELDFMELSPSRMLQQYEPLSPRAFQLLHAGATADLGLASFNPSKLPGQKGLSLAYTPTSITPNDANRIRFRRGLKWAATNLWNLNMNGELNIGAGKALYWRAIAKHNRNILPIWTCQQHLYNTHPYTWFAVAHESNTTAVEKLAQSLEMSLVQDHTTSYKISIKRTRDQLDCELNQALQVILLMMPWDRFLMSHVLRESMPDLRYLIRARHPIRRNIAEAYKDASIIRLTKDSVSSVLPPELGEVTYCCERVIRKWGIKLGGGVTLQLVETKRTPLIITREGDEGDRYEYELIANIPNKAENVDLTVFSDEMWSYGNEFAEVLEEGMTNLAAHVMPSSAAFDPISA